MNRTAARVSGGIGLALVCFGSVLAADTPAPSLVHDAMKDVIAVQAQVIWDIGNKAYNDDGDVDASKLKPEDWSRVVSAAGKVKQAIQAVTKTDPVVVARAGQKIDAEGARGAWGAKEVQKAINGNLPAFRAFAQQLQVSMDGIAAAATARNAARFGETSNQLDQVCEQCHLVFWYPKQKGS